MSNSAESASSCSTSVQPSATFLRADLWSNRVFNGGWVMPSGGTANVIEPATGRVLGSVGLAAPSDVATAGRAARQAQTNWKAVDYKERAAIFRRAAALVEKHSTELCDMILRETGGIMPKAAHEVERLIVTLQEAAAMLTQPQGLMLPATAGQLSLARRVPHGVVGVISPFNFPVILTIRAVAPALAVGNTVVIKPDPHTPISGGFLLARIFEEAGLPVGTLHVLPGGADVGEAMCSDPNIAMIVFTGSTQAGRRVAEVAGRHLKKVVLELGGKNSLIVLDDADPDVAASNVAWGSYLHQGQICIAAGRVLVQRKIADAVIERLVQKAKHLPVGDPASGQVALGPIINQRQLDRVKSLINDTVAAGARLLAGGTHEKLFYAPTVLVDVRPGMRAFEEELFGPVAAITVFDTDEEAIELANLGDGRIALGVISPSISRAMKIIDRVPAGHAHVNDQTVVAEVHAPFGGVGIAGNGSRQGGPADWEEFTQWQWVTIKGEAQRYPF